MGRRTVAGLGAIQRQTSEVLETSEVFWSDDLAVVERGRLQLGGALRPQAGDQLTAQELGFPVDREAPGHHFRPGEGIGGAPRFRPIAEQRELDRQLPMNSLIPAT